MKRILTYLGVLLPLLMFGGCQTQEQKTETESKFEQDLRGLYTKVQTITSQAQTRSIEGEFVPLTEAELTEIFTEIANISERNGIPEIVAQSGYYQNAETLDIAEMDIYDIMQWVEQNGTPEMYNLMLSPMSELALDQVVANDGLLPNEQLAAVFRLAIVINDTYSMTRAYPSTNEACYTAFVNARKKCIDIYSKRGWLSIATAASGAIYASYVVEEVLTSEANQCIGRADAEFNRCVQ